MGGVGPVSCRGLCLCGCGRASSRLSHSGQGPERQQEAEDVALLAAESGWL